MAQGCWRVRGCLLNISSCSGLLRKDGDVEKERIASWVAGPK